jgi:hypothetical protein
MAGQTARHRSGDQQAGDSAIAAERPQRADPAVPSSGGRTLMMNMLATCLLHCTYRAA